MKDWEFAQLQLATAPRPPRNHFTVRKVVKGAVRFGKKKKKKKVFQDEKITEKYPWNKDSKSMLHRNFSEKM